MTVVVLTHDRPDDLARVVQHLRQLPEHPRIVIVDNGSRDAAAVARHASDPQVTVVRSAHNLGAAGRNLGVAQVGTPYVAFCDDDTMWQAGSLRRACNVLDEYPNVGALNARVLVGPQCVEDPACARMRDSPLDNTGLPGAALISFMAGAVIMRTRAYRQTRGYEPKLFLGAEEALLGLNLATLGWRMVYDPEVVTHHLPSPARDRTHRRLILARNRLWVAWLRLPWADAQRETRVILAEARRQQQLWPVLWLALKGVPWVMLHRRVVPEIVAQMHRTVFAPAHAARYTVCADLPRIDVADG